MRILIIDDSVVMRSQIKLSLEGIPSFVVVGTAGNGKIALQKLQQITTDVIILDMEMPELSGIETIKAIRKAKIPVKILVFSSFTISGSEATLEALAAGADDFISKPSGADVNFENSVEKIREQLIPKLNQFKNIKEQIAENKNKTNVNTFASNFPGSKRDLSVFIPSVLVIGASTGGPPAIEIILSSLVNPLRIPILITQHMPPIFTTSFAKRLSDILKVPCEEAKNDELLKSGKIYIAPGGFHMSIAKKIIK